MNWMLATILICGASVFTSCSTSDDPVTPPVDSKKCTRFEVVYRITNPKANNTFFEGKYALMSNGQVKEINKLMPFAEQQNEGYNVNEIAAFPAEEAIGANIVTTV